jgi:hypothetical protein
MAHGCIVGRHFKGLPVKDGGMPSRISRPIRQIPAEQPETGPFRSPNRPERGGACDDSPQIRGSTWDFLAGHEVFRGAFFASMNRSRPFFGATLHPSVAAVIVKEWFTTRIEFKKAFQQRSHARGSWG